MNKKFKNYKLTYSSTRTGLGVEVIRAVGVNKILLLAPQPDDDVFGCGALLAHLPKK